MGNCQDDSKRAMYSMVSSSWPHEVRTHSATFLKAISIYEDFFKAYWSIDQEAGIFSVCCFPLIN